MTKNHSNTTFRIDFSLMSTLNHSSNDISNTTDTMSFMFERLMD